MDDDLFSRLYGNLDSSKQLLTAVSCNLMENLSELINNGVDVNSPVQSQNGNRALHLAASKGYKECVEKLLLAGANPDLPNDFGITALAMALRQGHVTCVRLLLATGSVLTDPNLVWTSQQPNTTTPIWVNYSPDLIRFLMIATPNLAELGPDVQNMIYEYYIKGTPNYDLIKTYCLTGNTLNAEQTAAITANCDEDFKAWMKGFQGVHSLQHYARLVTRNFLRPNTLYGTKILPLPTKLQEYLIFEDGTS